MRNAARLMFCLLAVGLMLAACGKKSAGPQDTSTQPPAQPGTTTPPTDPLVESGLTLFNNKGCRACHTVGGGKLVGPDLFDVAQRREVAWLKRWLQDPATMIKTDPSAQQMLTEYTVVMPDQKLSAEEIDALIAYLQSLIQKP